MGSLTLILQFLRQKPSICIFFLQCYTSWYAACKFLKRHPLCCIFPPHCNRSHVVANCPLSVIFSSWQKENKGLPIFQIACCSWVCRVLRRLQCTVCTKVILSASTKLSKSLNIKGDNYKFRFNIWSSFIGLKGQQTSFLDWNLVLPQTKKFMKFTISTSDKSIQIDWYWK